MIGHFLCEFCGKKYSYKKAFDEHLKSHEVKQPKILKAPEQDGLETVHIDILHPIFINGQEYSGIVRVTPELALELKRARGKLVQAEQEIYQFKDHRVKDEELANVGY